MKHVLVLVGFASSVFFALPASAQCPMSGAINDAGGAEPIQLVLKYSWKLPETRPTALKTALEKLPTVVRTAFDEKAKNQILVKFRGRCDQVAALESAAAASGIPAFVINHAHVAVVLKTKPGADVKGAVEAFGKVTGALYTKSSSTGLDLHADLNQLNMEEIRATAAQFKCEAVVDKTYEFVRFRVLEGSVATFQTTVEALKGVMVGRPEGNGVVGFWINKAAAKADQFEKLEGYKVKRL